MFVGTRVLSTSYVYGDPEHPERVTSSIPSPAYVEEDRALLLALQWHEDSLCPGCGQPKHVAWHSEMDGEFDTTDVVCHACSAGRDDKRTYSIVRDIRNPAKGPLPPFVVGRTTTDS